MQGLVYHEQTHKRSRKGQVTASVTAPTLRHVVVQAPVSFSTDAAKMIKISSSLREAKLGFVKNIKFNQVAVNELVEGEALLGAHTAVPLYVDPKAFLHVPLFFRRKVSAHHPLNPIDVAEAMHPTVIRMGDADIQQVLPQMLDHVIVILTNNKAMGHHPLILIERIRSSPTANAVANSSGHCKEYIHR